MTTNTMKRLAVCATCALLLAAASGCGGKTEDTGITDATITNGTTATGTAANASGSVGNSASGKGLPAGVPPDAAPRR